MDIRNWFQPRSQNKSQEATPERAETKTRRLVKKADVKAKRADSDAERDIETESPLPSSSTTLRAPIKRQKSNPEEINALAKKKRILDEKEDDDVHVKRSMSTRSVKKNKNELAKEEKGKEAKGEVFPSKFFDSSKKINRIERPKVVPVQATASIQTKSAKTDTKPPEKLNTDDDGYFDDFPDEALVDVVEPLPALKPDPPILKKAVAAESPKTSPVIEKNDTKSSPKKRKAKDVDESDDYQPKPEKIVKNIPVKQVISQSSMHDEKEPTGKQAAKVEKRELDPDEPHEESEAKKRKSSFWKLKARAPPQNLGSKEIPQGAPNCFAGLTFVFSGELESITREEAEDIAKRYGAKVTGAVSGRTSYLILGRDAGKAKLDKANQHKTKTLDEDGYLSLIRTSKEKPDDYMNTPTKGKSKAKEAENIEKLAAKIVVSSNGQTQLWTDKYKPQKMTDICGNRSLVQKIGNWLSNWDSNLTEGFKRSGPDETGIYRAILISGPPGIGKTTAAHLCARMKGFEVLEFNASDARSKKLLDENITELIDNRTMTEFFKGDRGVDMGVKDELAEKLKSGKKVVLIMDEVDGMSAGDRGGSAELAQLIKKTKIPIICICNDSRSQKVQSLAKHCFEAKFRRPDASMIRSRVMTIAHREGLKITGNVVDELVASTQSDIRQIINMLSTYRITHDSISYDEGKQLAKTNEKHIQLNVFQICERLFSVKAWQSMTVSEKLELYFHEYQLANLMIQENYPKLNPNLSRGDPCLSKKEIDCRTMDLVSRAADAISEGDLVDRMIHGTEQQWSLMPVHSAFSCVRPAYFMHGFSSGQDGRYNFPGWLGQNSKTIKYQRLLREVQIHMRLHISGDKNEVRQTYLPTLTRSLGLPIIEVCKALPTVLAEFHNPENFDTIMELELAVKGKQPLLKRFATATKAAFTRKYNAASHPMLFMKPVGVAGKKLSAVIEIPDLEDAFVDDEILAGGDASQEEDNGDGENVDSLKDSMIKKKGSGGKGSTMSKPKSKDNTAKGEEMTGLDRFRLLGIS
ncbi:hypothetical protein BC936DRAFT_148256 [Jimgerdemannia flammicorona]|uniref:Replication factor C subunit 1 n=1 Tax=Jimgerdemannia flammicorona TaxID=994334 RepID=A0A433D3H5_9FUNG|nr:hypothetical protein BC936DRAFT_148256 [Jimgerdemannia flammicorona]